MNSANKISFVCSNSPIDFELQNEGRVLIIKDALYNASTKKYHDIRLVRNGWKLLGFDLGGGGKFTGITDDVVRQIQSTYGIVLKTLNSAPNDAAFWGDKQKTSFVTAKDAAEKYPSKWFGPWSVKTSYPLGTKKDDLILSQEDSARFGADRMTLHEAIQAGIWNADGWINGQALSSRKDETSLGKATLPSSAANNPQKLGAKSKSSSPNSPTSSPKTAKNRTQESPAIDPANKTILKGISDSSGPEEQGASSANAKELSESSKSRDKSKYRASGDEKRHSGRFTSGNKASQVNSQDEERDSLIDFFPSIPVYRASSTPVEFGYDDAPFEERKRRMIAHLDNSSPIPFSAFVDNNLEKRIEPILFRRMVDALRRLADNPEVEDSDARFMKKLFKHWFRAAYHYLDQNSKPGDGYQQVVGKISNEIKDAEKAERKAKEIYWRRHATDFWMTLVDLFASEKIGIDLFHKSLSSKTSLNPWF